MKKALSVFLILGAMFSNSMSLAADEYRVNIDVSGEDDGTNLNIKTCLVRELRAIADVVVTDHDPSFEMQVIVKKVPYSIDEDDEVAYAISGINRKLFNIELLPPWMFPGLEVQEDRSIVRTEGNENAKSLVRTMTQGYGRITGQWIDLIDRKDLEYSCKELSRLFEATTLEQERRLQQVVDDVLKEKREGKVSDGK